MFNPDPHETAFEACCFCRNGTAMWVSNVAPKQSVACCAKCATVADVADLPTKAEWMRRERIVTAGRK